MINRVFWTVCACVGLLSLATDRTAAEPNPAEEVTTAARKLSEQENYTWTTKIVMPETARFRPGPIEGKTQRDGLTVVSMPVGNNTVQTVLKGDKAAATGRDGAWQSLAELEAAQRGARFIGLVVRTFKTPAAQALQLVTSSADLKKDGDHFSGVMTEQGAKALLIFGPTPAPEVDGAQGWVKFWVKDGLLAQYEFTVKGTVHVNGVARQVDRTTIVEIKNVGSTKLDVPEEAKKKLG